jgi:hypothetical protein
MTGRFRRWLPFTPIANVGSVIQPIGTSDYAWVGMLTGYADVVAREIARYVS